MLSFQFAESSIAQLETTRSSQQSQIQSLQMQVQNLETSVDVLGQFVLRMLDNNDTEIPDDVRRIVQQMNPQESHRRKPIFIERKIGKSMSVNSQLGLSLKVLEELSESMEKDGNTTKISPKKSTFFENTYNQLRKQSSQGRLNHIDDIENNKKSDNKTNEIKSESPDSGIATPLSPKEHHSITSIIETIPTKSCNSSSDASHPFGNCEDVNFKYNGTTQLKTLRPLHLRTSITASNVGDKHIDGRS